ncbi:MAG TPA: rod shape-determining protein RodA [Acidimicrobiales bacterium]|jgi:rod shape determining protein RodA|nr:rod shape-determining protein RodA [Acidimicrobiales bacterium]
MTDFGFPLQRRGWGRWRDIGPRRWARQASRAERRDPGLFRRKVDPAWKHVDLLLLLCAVAISALGALMILSATRGTDPDAYDLSFLRRQLMFEGMGFAAMVLVALVDYRRWRDRAWLPYLAIVVMLGLVLTAVGTEQRGTQAWFQIGAFQLQPAELAKVVAIVVVASFLGRSEPPLQARWVGGALVLLGLPMALILLQPDLGTAMVFVAIALGMLLVAGAKLRHLVVLVAVGTIGVIGVLNSDLLEKYQRDRLTTFLDQDHNLAAKTYNLNQSKIAIGSGGAGGKGLFEGTQTRLGNVPEQHTDFIFTALGEELGFAGSATLLALFWLLCWRIWRIAQMSRDRYGMLLCVGVLSMLVFQVFQNVGMTMGIMPITGIPLPFMSYGGSSTLAAWIAIGLVLNVHMRRFR